MARFRQGIRGQRQVVALGPPDPGKGYKMACCDCGLVHDMDFRECWRRPRHPVPRRPQQSIKQDR